MDLKLIIHKKHIYDACPKCNSYGTLERIKSNNRYEKAVLILSRFKKYHCKECKWEGKLFLYTVSKNYFEILINYVFLGVIIIVLSYFLNLLFERFFYPSFLFFNL